MIPWWSVFFNGLWVLGLAILLAGLSFNYYISASEGRRFREQLQSSGFRQIFWLSFAFVAAGLAGTSDEIWTLVIWVLFLLYCLFNLVLIRRSIR